MSLDPGERLATEPWRAGCVSMRFGRVVNVNPAPRNQSCSSSPRPPNEITHEAFACSPSRTADRRPRPSSSSSSAIALSSRGSSVNTLATIGSPFSLLSASFSLSNQPSTCA